MKRSTSRWATAMAAAALIALPAAGYTQTASPQTQPQTPPAQSTAPQTSQASASSPAEHVRAAKQAVSSIQANSLPASARPQLAQLRTHLNNLEKEVAKADKEGAAAPSAKSKSSASWGTEVAAIDKIITDMIGSDTGSAASTGAMSSGTAGSATGTAGRDTATIDDATKGQLREVRRQITELATSMSGSSAPKTDPTPSASAPETMAASPAAGAAGAPSPTANPSTATPAQATPPESAPAPTAPATQQTTPSATQQTTPASAQPPAAAEPQGRVDREAAKQHLSEARESLSQLAGLPEAAKLQGETRNQVSQLIANFNELITTQSDWKASYAKLEGTLNSLLGSSPSAAAPSAAGTTGTATPAPAGTTGTAAGTLEPPVRAKLEEFRTHMKAFAEAAGGVAESGGMSPSVSAGSANSPANPQPSAASPASPAAPTAAPATPEATPSTPAATPSQTPTPTPSATPGATGTSGSMSPAATDAGASSADADKHLDAIDQILSKAKDGKLDKEQTDQIKMHLDQLRQLLKK